MEARNETLAADKLFCSLKRTRVVEDRSKDNKSGAARLLEIKQMLFELQERVDEEKATFTENEAKFKEREDKMQAKNTELEESLVQFSKYLQENDAKKARAFKKAADEERQCEERIKEAEDLHHLYSYQRYLERVLEHKENLHEIGDIITRHATLASTNDTLRQQQQHLAEEIDNVRLETQQYSQVKAEQILAANTAIPRLRKEIETLKLQSSSLQSKRLEAAHRKAQQSLEKTKVVMASKLLFEQVLQNSKVAHSSQAGTAAQLKIIGNFISDCLSNPEVGSN